MGQAKRRGTFEQRLQQALERRSKDLRGMGIDRTAVNVTAGAPPITKPNRRHVSRMSILAVAALAAGALPVVTTNPKPQDVK